MRIISCRKLLNVAISHVSCIDGLRDVEFHDLPGITNDGIKQLLRLTPLTSLVLWYCEGVTHACYSYFNHFLALTCAFGAALPDNRHLGWLLLHPGI